MNTVYSSHARGGGGGGGQLTDHDKKIHHHCLDSNKNYNLAHFPNAENVHKLR